MALDITSATPLTMAKFRVRLDRDPAPFERLVRSLARQEVFQLTGGDSKHPKGESPPPLLSPWYNKKSLALECGRKLGRAPLLPRPGGYAAGGI